METPGRTHWGWLVKISRESWILSIICVLDLTTTIWLVSMHGAREGNTLMSYFLEVGFGPFILAKTAMFMIPIALLEWARRSNPKFVIGTLRCGIALYVGIYTMGVFSINANRNRDE